MIEQERTTIPFARRSRRVLFSFLFFCCRFLHRPWTYSILSKKTCFYYTTIGRRLLRELHQKSNDGGTSIRAPVRLRDDAKKKKDTGTNLRFPTPLMDGRKSHPLPPYRGGGRYGSVNEAVRGEIDGKIGFASISLPFVK